MSTRTFLHVCAALATVGLAIAVIACLPMLSNADDNMTYYAGGYVAASRLHLAPATVADPRSILEITDLRELGRRKTMLSSYALVWIPQAALLDGLRRLFAPAAAIYNWAVISATVVGLSWLAAMAWLLRRSFPEHSVAWLVTVLTITVFIHQHTRPFDPVPRNFSTFACGVAIALAVKRDRASVRVWLLLALAASLHTFQELLNLAAAAGVLLLVRPRRLLDTIAPGVVFSVVAFGIAMAISTLPLQAPSTFLGSPESAGWAANWASNRVAAVQVSRYMAPLLALLVWSISDWRRGALAGAAVVAFTVAAGVFTDAGVYAGEYPNRLGGAWNCVIFALLLQRDWLAAAAAAMPPGRRWAMGACVAVLAVMALRMDARYILRHRIDTFRERLASVGFNYPPGPTEGSGLALIPRRVQ